MFTSKVGSHLGFVKKFVSGGVANEISGVMNWIRNPIVHKNEAHIFATSTKIIMNWVTKSKGAFSNRVANRQGGKMAAGNRAST